jgi:hypothetical protein
VDHKHKELVFTKVRVNFLFSFCLDFGNIPFDNYSVSDTTMDTILGMVKKHFLQKHHQGVSVNEGVPENRKGLQAALCTQFPGRIHLIWPLRDAVLVYKESSKNLNLSVCTMIQLFSTGMGLCDVTVETPEEIDVTTQDLHCILDLANEWSRHGMTALKLKEGNELLTPYDIFIESFHEMFDSFHAEEKSNYSVDWRAISPRVTRFGVVSSRVDWLDSRIVKFALDQPYQQPYIVTEVFLPKESYQNIFLDTGSDTNIDDVKIKRKRFQKSFAAILLREVFFDNIPFIDTTFPAWTSEGLSDLDFPSNLNLNSRLFCSVHCRSALVVRDASLPKTHDPGFFIVPGLLSMIDLVRGRRHAMLVINGLLDGLIRDLKSELGYSREMVISILRWRIKLADVLEDPLLYHWGGGSMPEAYEVARRGFALERLQNLALQKFSVLDRLLSDILRTQDIEIFLKQ